MTKEVKILIGIAVVVIIGGVLLAIYANPQPSQPGQAVDSQSLVRDTSHMTGKKDAKVTFVEFGDFQCPACGAAFPVVEQVLEGYKDNSNLNFVFRDFPLESIHPNARIGAEAAEAAGDQGKFWEMYRILYQKQNEWSVSPSPIDAFMSYAQTLGLNTDQFKQAIEQHKFKAVIDADLDDGNKIGVNATPTFYINGVKFEYSTLTPEALKARLDEELNK